MQARRRSPWGRANVSACAGARRGESVKIEYIREFVDLAECLSFTVTARRQYISQPVLSTHIKSLEKELGFTLFDRDCHSVKLTRSGRLFYEEAVQIIAHYDRALLAIERSGKHDGDQLSVGYLHYAFGGIMPEAANTFRELYPQTHLRTVVYGYKGAAQALMDNSVDLVLTLDVDDKLRHYCNVTKLGEDPVRLMVNERDPLAKAQLLSLPTLRDEPFVLPHPHFSDVFPWFYSGLFERAGFVPKAAKYYCNVAARLRCVQQNQGVALVGNHLRRANLGKTVFVDLVEDWCRYDLAAMWRKDTKNLAIEDFIEILCSLSAKESLFAGPQEEYLESRVEAEHTA
jgi:DNA-binding transcriptional LysR family regulator